MRKTLKRCLRGVLFACLLAAGLRLTVLALYPMNDIVRGWAAFYRLESNSVDVLIVGGSHAYSSFDPERFTRTTGQTAYILAGSSQITAQSYYNVREALAYQRPETILLETFGLNNNDLWQNARDNDRVWQKESNLDGMRLGLTKLEAAAVQYRPENWVYALCPIIRCHTGWADNSRIPENWQFYCRDVRE